jgi:hypothetical protein
VYAELATVFTSHDDLRAFFTTTGVRLVPSDEVALWQAGQAWDRYRQRRPTHLECPHCGTPNRVACTGCGSSLTPRQHVVADFIIGAHAQHHADAPLTRDRGYYRTYFPGLTLLHP